MINIQDGISIAILSISFNARLKDSAGVRFCLKLSVNSFIDSLAFLDKYNLCSLIVSIILTLLSDMKFITSSSIVSKIFPLISILSMTASIKISDTLSLILSTTNSILWSIKLPNKLPNIPLVAIDKPAPIVSLIVLSDFIFLNWSVKLSNNSSNKNILLVVDLSASINIVFVSFSFNGWL